MAKGMKSDRIPKDEVGIPTIEFIKNDNNKLFADSFTVIQLWDEKKFIVGQNYKLITPVKDMVHNAPTIWGQAKLVEARRFTIPHINNFISYLDMGYSAEEAKELLITIYSSKIDGRDIEQEPFGLYLMVKQFK